MSCGVLNIGAGMQMVMDAQMRFIRQSHPIYLRLRNFPQSPVVAGNIFQQLGLPYTPPTGPTGTQDLLIDPPPSMRMLSQHDIGMSLGKLRFGARQFLVSGSFVDTINCVDNLGLTQSQLEGFWKAANVVGLVTDNLLFSIEQVAHEELGGHTILWTLDANAPDLKTTVVTP